MAHELWHPSLSLALHRNRQSLQSRFVQLATVRKDGRPAVRTVVFRGLLGESHRLGFATDARSVKVDELHASPWVEACWYFPITREQFRLSGTMTLIGPETTDPVAREARERIWREMSEESRLSYTWPDPGRAREPSRPFPTEPPDADAPLPHYCLLVLDVQEVDHLELTGNPQHRWRYTQDASGRWTGVEVNP
ncbi:MAG: Npun_F5749 family FMN-dependent PPOX-type flavoprotein [Isosphaeraceae bacterium]